MKFLITVLVSAILVSIAGVCFLIGFMISKKTLQKGCGKKNCCRDKEKCYGLDKRSDELAKSRKDDSDIQ
ncbi:MAG: hypothetical protein RSB82_01905 [Victivallaceae bacterium]